MRDPGDVTVHVYEPRETDGELRAALIDSSLTAHDVRLAEAAHGQDLDDLAWMRRIRRRGR